MTLLRAMGPEYSTDADIIRAFYPTEDGQGQSGKSGKLEGQSLADDIIDPETGEVFAESGEAPSPGSRQLLTSSVKEISILGTIKEHRDHPTARCLKIRRKLTRLPCSRFTNGCGLGIPPNWRRPRNSSRKNSRIPTAIAWAKSAGSESTANSIRTFRNRK